MVLIRYGKVTDTQTNAFAIKSLFLSSKEEAGWEEGRGRAQGCEGPALFGWRDYKRRLVPDSSRKNKCKFYTLAAANHSNKNGIYTLKLLLKRIFFFKVRKENSSFTLKGVERRVRNNKKAKLIQNKMTRVKPSVFYFLVCEYV